MKTRRIKYKARLKFLRAQLSNTRGERREGIKQGIEQGVQQGLEQGRREIIQKMLHKGLDGETIAIILECSREDVEKRQNQCN